MKTTDTPSTPREHRLAAILLGLAISAFAMQACHAMSELSGISIEPLWPTTANPGGVTLYKVTVNRAGQGILNVDVSLSAGNLPVGATATFTPAALQFKGRVPLTQTATLAITCPTPTPTDDYPFSVTGTSRREVLTVTNQVGVLRAPLASPDGRPALLVDSLSNGFLNLRGRGQTAAAYQIEATANLTTPNWAPVGVSNADGNGRFTYLAAWQADMESRFFRTATGE